MQADLIELHKQPRESFQDSKEMCHQNNGIFSAYVQIPFCRTRCNFCGWTKKYASSDLLHIEKHKRPYIDSLKREIRFRAENIDDGPLALKVVHFGGGTPSLLEAEEIEEIFSCLCESYQFTRSDLVNITIEANPGDLDKKKLRALKNIGINRISLGVQTFNHKLLKKLNRPDTPEDIYCTYETIRDLGFDDVSFDLLSAFPGQTMEEMKFDYDTALSMAPDHIQTFYWRPVEGKLLASLKCEKDDYLSWWEYVHSLLAERGYENYCYRLYSKPGKESLFHLNNAAYINPFIAFGPGTQQYLRQETEPDIKEYIERDSFKDFYQNKESEFSLFPYVLRNHLTIPEGLHIPSFNKRFNKDLMKLLDRGNTPAALHDELLGRDIKTGEEFIKRTELIPLIKNVKKMLDDRTLLINKDYLHLNIDKTTPYEMWR